jgi:Protein of unknown function (DUF3307)
VTGQMVLLLAGFFFAHYLGDFTPLATQGMLAAKMNAQPMWLIAAHAAVHTLLIAIVIVAVVFPAWTILLLAAAIQFVTHFTLDAGRARLGRRFPAMNDPLRSRFWQVLGVDQLAHALVLIGLAVLVL